MVKFWKNFTYNFSYMLLFMAGTDPRAKLVDDALNRNRLSYRWLASRLDVSHVSIANWLKGEFKPRSSDFWRNALDAIAEYQRANLTDASDVTIKRTGVRRVIVYPGLSAGSLTSSMSDTYTIEVKETGAGREQWGRVIDGYSMSPVLEPGDIVIFEARPWEPWHIVHAFDNGEDTVKVARGTGSKVELLPINPDYEAIPGKNINIKGVAIMRIRKGPNDEVTTTEYPHGMRYRISETLGL